MCIYIYINMGYQPVPNLDQFPSWPGRHIQRNDPSPARRPCAGDTHVPTIPRRRGGLGLSITSAAWRGKFWQNRWKNTLGPTWIHWENSSFLKKNHKSNESWDSEQIAKTPADCWSNSVFEFCMFLASLWEFTQFTLPLCPVGSFLRLNSHFALLLGKVLEAESAWWVLPGSWHCEHGGCNLWGESD